MKKINSNKCYIAALIIYILFNFISKSTIPITIHNYRYIIYGIILALLILSRIDIIIELIKKQIWKSILWVILLFILFNIHFDLLISGIFILALDKKNMDKVIKTYFYVSLISLVLLFVLSRIGIIEDYTIYNYKGLIRHSLGTIQPNAFFTFFMMLIITSFYIVKKKDILFFSIITFLTIYVYKLTICRTGLLIFIIFIMLYYLFCYKRIKFHWSFKYFPLLAVIFSLFLINMYHYNMPYSDKINDALSGRLKYSQYFINEYGVSLLGNKIEYKTQNVGINEELNILDISYVYMLVDLGFIVTIVILSSTIYLLYVLDKKNKKLEYITIVAILIYGFTERFIFSIAPNIFILLFVYMWDGDLCEDRNRWKAIKEK